MQLCLTNSISVAIRRKVLTEVENKLRTARLLETYEYYEVGKRITSALLNSKELSRIAYERYFDKPSEADKVLEANIFAYHPTTNTITFQSRSVEFYFQENSTKNILIREI